MAIELTSGPYVQPLSRQGVETRNAGHSIGAVEIIDCGTKVLEVEGSSRNRRVASIP